MVKLSKDEKKQRVLGVERRDLDRFRNDVAESQALVEAESKTHKLHGLFEIATVRRDDSKGRALMVEAGIQALLRDQLVQRLLEVVDRVDPVGCLRQRSPVTWHLDLSE